MFLPLISILASYWIKPLVKSLKKSLLFYFLRDILCLYLCELTGKNFSSESFEMVQRLVKLDMVSNQRIRYVVRIFHNNIENYIVAQKN